MGFVHLHVHSEYSFHQGTASVEDIVRRAKALGMSAIALTDTDRMSGLVRFYLECRKQNIKPILGVELTEPGKPHENIVLLARNAEGYCDICEIITRRHVDSHSFSFAGVFSKPWRNLFLFTNYPHLLELLAQTPNHPGLLGEIINNSPLTRRRSRELACKAEALHIPLIVSNDSFFLDTDDWQTHRLLTAIGLNSTLSRLKPCEYASEKASLRPGPEMERLFPNHAEAIGRTKDIADQCNVSLDLGKWILPTISTPKGDTPESYLAKCAWTGLEENYGGRESYNEARAIQEMELRVIARLGYSSYFLFVKDIREWANNRFKGKYRSPKDCTILRGSAANSITFYNLGVSDLDPIRYDLYFERFLNEDRASPPDADLDFAWDERDQALDYIADKWGQDRVAITCTVNHFRNRAAFRETAKVFGYSEEEITEILKSRKTKTKRIEDSEIHHIMELAEKITGKPRFLGQHPGGVIITNSPIWRHVACEYSGGEKNRIITQIDMHSGIDELGLIKFDVLGNGSLAVLRDTLQQLEDQHLPDPNVWDLEKCYHDPKVKEIMRHGKTRGIFYIESPAQTRLNTKAQAETFEEITITSSLIRPAGTGYTQTFVERHRKAKMGITDWDFLHPSLEPILKDSHDVCAFQEDVTKICHQVAGLSFKKADRIRKQMNCSHEGSVAFDEWEQTAQEFLQGCMSRSGLSKEQAFELWQRVSSFSGFSFCKSHSASYAQLSFQCAYLKAHYPAQFLSAVISNNHGFYSRDVYLDEARRWGIRILPMSINESDAKYWGKHTWIRPGFMHVRNLRRRSTDAITEERGRNGPYHNLVDFVERMNTHKKEIENLILIGAFDGFGLTQPESLYLLDDIYGSVRTDSPMLFESDMSYRNQKYHPGLDDYTFTERCLNELRLLGFMLSGNILDILDIHPASKGAVAANRIQYHVGRRIKVFGWPITRRVHDVSSRGAPMLFMTIEDKTECVDTIFWPRAYEEYSDILLAEPGPFEIWGKVGEDWDTYTVEADAIRAVEWSPAQIDFELASKRLQKSFSEHYTHEDIRQIAAA